MAERAVSGKDTVVMISTNLVTPDYDLIVCLTSNDLQRSTNVIDASSKCGPSKQPGAKDINVTFEGINMIDPDSGRLSGADLHALWAADTPFLWKIGKATPVTDDPVYSGSGFISELGETWAMDSATFSGAIGITGDIDLDITP